MLLVFYWYAMYQVSRRLQVWAANDTFTRFRAKAGVLRLDRGG